VSDQVIISLIGSLIALLGTMFSGYMAFKMAQLNASQKEAAVEVVKVKETLAASTVAADEKMNSLAKVADATHTLVNSSMSAQLKISAVALRRIAELTKNPEDDAAAKLAEKLDKEHTIKQSVVDAKTTKVGDQ
jgi:hypothetical protein